jgi:DNA polymerase-3 subunit gamma/tau
MGTAFLLIRSVRKLTRRFDQHLWSDMRNKKTMPLVEKLETLLMEFEETDGVLSGNGAIEVSGITGLLDEIGKEVLRLEHALPHDPVPVDLVRSIASWARLSSAAGSRVVILEEAHTLQEGARNAMLKALEEPPDNTFFILTSSRRSAIIPTIRSRLRIYEVPERPREIQRDVQRKIFRREETVPSLREFFRGQGGGGDDDWSPLARDLVTAIEGGASTAAVEHRLREILGRVSPRHGAEYFLDALEEEIRVRLKSGDEEQIPAAVLVRWGEIIGRYWSRIDSRNMNPPAVLAGAILAMQAAAAAR